MKKEILFLLFFVITNLTFAQIATTNWIYQIDEDAKKDNRQSLSTTLKLHNKEGIRDTENLFGITLAKNIRAGKITIYKDPECTQPISQSTVNDYLTQSFIDTVISFDPETFERKQHIVKSEYSIFPSDVAAVHFNQKWFYNEKSNQITTVVESITVHYMETGQPILKFHIKVNHNTPITTDLFSDNQFILGQRIRYTGDFTGFDMAKYVFDEAHQTSNTLYNKLGEPLDEKKFTDDFGSYIDTVIIFNPETFREEIKIIKHPPIHHPDIKDFQVVQDVYIDPENMMIKIQILGIAPTRPMFDDNDNFKYYSPLAWIVYDKAFFNQ